MSGLHQISWREFEKFLVEIGCVFIREKGDHRIWEKEGLGRPIVLPRNNPLPIFVVRNNLRLLGFSADEYLRITKKHR
jgi:predicted RNA binding protein YcfA (HicA-like mRNA interferase family)